MKITEAIFKRRSIRHYKLQGIEHAVILELVKAGMYAPSARNLQPWHFLVVDDRKVLNDLSVVHPYAEMLQTASLAILICGDTTVEPTEAYIVQNCSAATQNILLAAMEYGLGTVWLGVYPRKERINGIKTLLHIPEHILPVSLIAVGYSVEEKETPQRLNKERIHFNYFSL